MKVLFFAAICIFLMFYAGGALSESDEICCTWITTKFVSGDRPQKLIINFDGTL
jgi:hypothetical protein